MASVKNILQKATMSGTIIASMVLGNGCATIDEQTNNETKNRIILSKDYDSVKDLSNADRVGFMSALKEVRQAEAKKYYYDEEKKSYALKCFDACGGAFIQNGKKYSYMPSKYEFEKNACLCNGQDIIPHKEKETLELELKACTQICESANTDKIKYTADAAKTRPFSECVCKKIVEDKQNQK